MSVTVQHERCVSERQICFQIYIVQQLHRVLRSAVGPDCIHCRCQRSVNTIIQCSAAHRNCRSSYDIITIGLSNQGFARNTIQIEGIRCSMGRLYQNSPVLRDFIPADLYFSRAGNLAPDDQFFKSCRLLFKEYLRITCGSIPSINGCCSHLRSGRNRDASASGNLNGLTIISSRENRNIRIFQNQFTQGRRTASR